MNIKEVFQNNEKWVQSKLDLDQDYFENLDRGQSPEFLYIGCSDSRVTPEGMLGIKPGDAFVHRNIANLVTESDLSVMSVLTYGIEHLNIRHIVICGHYSCGGVAAAMTESDLGTLNPWIQNIRNVYSKHLEELEGIENEKTRYDRLADLNVQEQCNNLVKTELFQKANSEGTLTVHGWVFDISSGKLIDLHVNPQP